jgi:hypothetical protein
MESLHEQTAQRVDKHTYIERLGAEAGSALKRTCLMLFREREDASTYLPSESAVAIQVSSTTLPSRVRKR